MCDKTDKLYLCKTLYWPCYFSEGTIASSHIFLGMLKCWLWVFSSIFMLIQVYLCHKNCEKRCMHVFSLIIISLFFFFWVRGKICSLSRNLDTPPRLCCICAANSGTADGIDCLIWETLSLLLGLGEVWTTGTFENFNYEQLTGLNITLILSQEKYILY